MPLTNVNGIDLYFEESGSGPPLLLICGLSANTLDWTGLEPALAERFRVIALDNRGAGRSAAPPGPYTTRLLAEDAVALLDHLGVGETHVIGHSLGGLIAQELAVAHPARVGRLVLYGTFARPRQAFLGPWLTNVVRLAEHGDPTVMWLSLMPWFLTPAFMTQHDLVAATLADWASDPYPAPGHGVAAQAAAARAHDTRDRLPRITAPTLVLVGAEDIVTPVSYSEELAHGIPGARLQVIDGCGHVATVERPEAVAAALLAFLTA